MLRLLGQVSLRELRGRRGRAGLLLGAVATGVSLIVAVGVINGSVIASFQRTFAEVAGPADLEVTLGHGEVGFDEAVVETIRRDPDVAQAVPFVHGTVALADDPSATLQLFGAELTAEDDLARYGVHLTTARRDALNVIEDPLGILVTKTVADRLGVNVGSSLRLATTRGMGTFTVRGLLAPDGLAAALAGQLAVMDLAAAQTQLAKDGKADQVDVMLRPGADPSVVRSRLAAALSPGFSVARPAARSERYAGILQGLQSTLAGMSLMCMVAGLLVIHNGISASVVHRMPAIATLRHLGADGPVLFRLVLTEAFVVGIVGSVIGVVVGIALSRLLLVLIGNTLGTMVQMQFIVPTVAIESRDLLFAMLLGTGAAVLAAWLPARRAMRVEPLAMMREWHRSSPRAGTLVAVVLAFFASGVGAVLLGSRIRDGGLIAAGSVTWYLSASAFGVPYVIALSRLLEWLLPGLYGVEGRVAAASVTRAPVRAGITVGTVGYTFAIAVTLAAVIESYVIAARAFVAELHDGDLVVSAVATEGGWLEVPVSDELAEAVRRVPGVARIESARVVPGQHYGMGRIGILALEPAALLRFGETLWRGGDRVRARSALAAGEGVAVSTVFADTYGLHTGDRIVLETPTGARPFPIVGEIMDMTSSSGAVLLSRAVYADAWQDRTVSRVNVFLEPGTSTEEVSRRIAAAVGDRYRLKINALRESLAYIDGKIRDAFGFSRSLQLLIVIVAIAGTFDLLFARIFERRRELAVWRIVGAGERAIQRSVIAESLALGTLASGLGLPFGIAAAWLWVRAIIPSLVGYDIPLLFPVFGCLTTIAVVLAATVVAGRAAARAATRASILESLRAD